MKHIPYGKQSINQDDIDAVISVMKSDWLTTGPKVPEFEQAICNYIGCKHAVAVNSGTSALDIAIQSLQLPRCSEIITTPFTFVASSNAILYNDLTPVFVDIEPDTCNIDVSKIEEKITPLTKAILYVDYAGLPCNIDILQEIASEYNLFLIEDAAHSLGAEYNNKKIGNFADITTFSFHPIKAITTGEGGAVVTDNSCLYDRMIMLRNHGISKDIHQRSEQQYPWHYDMEYLGRNYRMTDIQAALGISQLKRIDEFISKRQDITSRYKEYFINIQLPHERPYKYKHGCHLFTILFYDKKTRDNCFTHMRKAGIGVNLHYIPVYRHNYYINRFNIDPKLFPVTEDIYSRIMTLPLYPSLSFEEHEYICFILHEFMESL